MIKKLSSSRDTLRVRPALAVMLIASGVMITVIAFLVDTPIFLRNQVKKKLTTELKQSTIQEILPGSSPDDFMRIRSGSSTSESMKAP